MVQIIEDPYKGGGANIFGRIGSSLGRGFAEQAPKEMARSRLAQGFSELGQQENLSPLEYFTKAISIPGALEHPQLIESLGRLIQQQNMRKAYGQSGVQRDRGQTLEPALRDASSSLRDISFANLPDQRQLQEKFIPKTDVVKSSEIGQPQIVTKSPIRGEAIPTKRWTPERFKDEVSDILGSGITNDINEARGIAKENEARELAQSEGERESDEYLEAQQKKIRDKLIDRLELLTQKKGDALFQDIPGELQNNFIRTVEKDLRRNPNLTVEDVVNKRAKDLLEIPKTKNVLNKIASRDILDKINPLKKKENLQKLKDASEIFRKVGDNEEFYNELISKFGLSPSKSAWISYPSNKEFKKYINSVKEKKGADYQKTANEYAKNVLDLIQSEDSILAMFEDLREKNPYFDPNVFFDYIRKNLSQASLNDRQRRELVEGEPDYFPSWGDMSIFPLTRGGLL